MKKSRTIGSDSGAAAEAEARLRAAEESAASRALELRRLKARLELAESRAARLHESYLRRLTNQTESTRILSETVSSVLGAVTEMASSYREMQEAVRSVAQVCRELGDSFEEQARTQSSITQRTEAVEGASAEELHKAGALKEALGKLASIRGFMSTAMDTIADVSDRLSLLSMNGRIEAAHAGAAGRGFAVVAQEMLKLQQESNRIITSQKSQLDDFLPLMSAMQAESDGVEGQARTQQASIREIAGGSRALNEQTKRNQGRIAELGSAVEELAASVEEGMRTTGAIEERTASVKDIFQEEVFVSQKVNNLDAFLFDIAAKAGSVAELGRLLVNEYQRISVLNGASYIWQGESWLVSSRDRLPPRLREEAAPLGDRLLVCIGQTEDNRPFPQPLDPGSGILALRPLSDIEDPSSPLQLLVPVLERCGLSLADLRDPTRVDQRAEHANMAVVEDFQGAYARALADRIRRGSLVSAFGFGGLFPSGDFLVNLFLSSYRRHQSDALKFGMIGETMVLAFHSLLENGPYWLA